MSGEMIMPFGEYKDQQVMDVPRDRLEWYLEQWDQEKTWIKKCASPELIKDMEHNLQRRERSGDTY